MRINSKVRMNRLFNGGRCLDVAIDHGVCNEPILPERLENMGVRGEDTHPRRPPHAIQITTPGRSAAGSARERTSRRSSCASTWAIPITASAHRDMWAVLAKRKPSR